MSFCPTRMAYLLTACGHCVNLLVPLCSVLISLEIKKEQSAIFLTPKCMFILHALADLEVPFKKYFLKVLDTDKANAMDVFRINLEFAERLGNLIHHQYYFQDSQFLNTEFSEYDTCNMPYHILSCQIIIIMIVH